METITSSINYTAPLDLYKTEKPFFSNVPAPDGKHSNQVAKSYEPIEFHDIRSSPKTFTLDQNGFEVFKYGKEEDEAGFETDKWIEQLYYPVIESLLKARLGTVNVKIFDHTVRRRRVAYEERETRVSRQPSHSAHCDQTFFSGQNRVRFHMGSAAPDLLKKRCQIINVWRPLFGPVQDCPLTYCDWQTVDVARDFLPADLIFPHYIGEQYLVTHHPDHRWYFLSDQRSNEFTLLKCWDSATDVARCVPHTSFINPMTPKDAKLRESVEFRCLVFHE